MRSSLLLPRRLGAFVPFVCFLCLGTAVQAQSKGKAKNEQPDSRMEQILRPDPYRRFDLVYDKKAGTKGFSAPSGRMIETKAAETREFRTKGFLANAYRADKAYSQGATSYNVSDSQKKKLSFTSWFQGKSYSTKASTSPKDYQDNGKKYKDSAASTPTRDYRGKERDAMNRKLTPEQAANNGYKGDLREMKSIDDVRALLNKN